MSLIPWQQKKYNGVLLLENLHGEFLSLILDKLDIGHEASLSLCLSSCRPEEGVSTIIFNMAVALSRNTDRRILVVDANTRKPQLHSWFGIPKGAPGLIDVLTGQACFEEVLNKDAKNNFSFIPTGMETQHPIVLFEGKTIDDFLDEARQQFDILLFDSPALVIGPETSVLARKLDGLIMVIEAEKTRWEVSTYHKQQLVEAGVCLTGAILNKKKMFIPKLFYRLMLAD
ncbi:MAG: CpsD/CapB family tyrosine-protein kinase [Pseudomonadota bacterium]